MNTHQIPGECAADRYEWGRSVRERVSLESHAELYDPGSRDPVGLIQGQEASRLQSLVPLRHERMRASVFTFYRGSTITGGRSRAYPCLLSGCYRMAQGSMDFFGCVRR